MKEFRKAKGVTEHYSSLEELGQAWGCKPKFKKQPKDQKALQEAREKFLGTCPVCKSPMKYVCSDYSVCSNEKCKGKNISKKGEEPRYVLVMNEFRGKAKEIAKNLFE